jgi:hypothetical protein
VYIDVCVGGQEQVALHQVQPKSSQKILDKQKAAREYYFLVPTLIIKREKYFSYIRKFRMDRFQSFI